MDSTQDKKRRIHSIEKVQYSLLKRFPPILVVEAEGRVAGLGWNTPELRCLSPNEPPQGGLLELEFVATPPAVLLGEAAQPVRAQLYWRDDVEAIEGIKVYAATNDKTTVLGRQ